MSASHQARDASMLLLGRFYTTKTHTRHYRGTAAQRLRANKSKFFRSPHGYL